MNSYYCAMQCYSLILVFPISVPFHAILENISLRFTALDKQTIL